MILAAPNKIFENVKKFNQLISRNGRIAIGFDKLGYALLDFFLIYWIFSEDIRPVQRQS
jgi:hypothetical protein